MESQTTTILGIEAQTVILGIEAAALVATLLFMYYQYRKTIRVMQSQISELKDQTRISTHADIYEKLLTLYYKYMEYPEDLKGLFRSHEGIDRAEMRRRYMVFAILDILYLMYLQRETLDPGLLKTWEIWITQIFEEPTLNRIYEMVKKEYDDTYISYLESKHKVVESK